MKSAVFMGIVAQATTAYSAVVLTEGQQMPVPEDQQYPKLVTGQMNSCWKVNIKPREGPNFPCPSRGFIEHLCRPNGTTQEHLQAHRDCMCGEGSSYWQDSDACVSCMYGYGLSGEADAAYFRKFNQRLETSFCKAKHLTGDFRSYYQAANPVPDTPMWNTPANPIKNVFGGQGVVAVEEYYPNAPKQGPGKFTPVPPKNGEAPPPYESTVHLDDLQPRVAAKVKVAPDAAASAPVSAPVSASASASAHPRAPSSTGVARPVVSFKNSSAPASAPSYTVVNPKWTTVNGNLVNGNLIQVFNLCLTAKCSYVFAGSSIMSFKLVCDDDNVVPESVTKVVTPEQKKISEPLVDIGECECISKVPFDMSSIDNKNTSPAGDRESRPHGGDNKDKDHSGPDSKGPSGGDREVPAHSDSDKVGPPSDSNKETVICTVDCEVKDIPAGDRPGAPDNKGDNNKGPNKGDNKGPNKGDTQGSRNSTAPVIAGAASMGASSLFAVLVAGIALVAM